MSIETINGFPILENPGIVQGDPLSVIGTKVLIFQFVEFLKNKKIYNTSFSVEAVHDMRVAIRRMRVAGRVFEEFYEPEPFKRYRDHLKGMGARLGVVRDYDVFFEGLDHEELSNWLGESPVLGKFLEILENKHAVAREDVRIFLKSSDFINFIEGVSEFLGNPNYRFHPKDTQATEVGSFIRKVLTKRMNTLFKYNAIIDDLSLQQYHRLRINAKKFRYALEFFAPVVGDKAAEAIEKLKDLQDLLGEMNDNVVALEIILGGINEMSEGNDRVENGGVDHLLNDKKNRLDELVKRFPEIWEGFNQPDFRNNLISVVEGIA